MKSEVITIAKKSWHACTCVLTYYCNGILFAFSIYQQLLADNKLILHCILQIDFQRHTEQRVKNVLSYIICYRVFKNHCDSTLNAYAEQKIIFEPFAHCIELLGTKIFQFKRVQFCTSKSFRIFLYIFLAQQYCAIRRIHMYLLSFIQSIHFKSVQMNNNGLIC